ncbi:hypothetical protein HAP94_24705 [Acidithiobacillus ferrivorans]|nr:hypothetical protein [Acidithiobacillus ferrivorans]
MATTKNEMLDALLQRAHGRCRGERHEPSLAKALGTEVRRPVRATEPHYGKTL